MIIIDCLDSSFNINNLKYNNDNIEFYEIEKIILIPNKIINNLKQDILLINQLLDNIEYNNDEIITIPLKNILFEDMKFILKFYIIKNNDIINFIIDLNENDKYVSSINTNNMPKCLQNFLNNYTIYNTIDIFEINNIDNDYNKLKYIQNIIKISDYLQYDLLCDVMQYKYADNLRIINREILKIIMNRKSSNDVIEQLIFDLDQLY
jgi:hypothetical protein